MKLSSTEKKMRNLDYIKGFLFKIKDLTFAEVHAAHDVAEWISKEDGKLEKKMVKKGNFDDAGEFRTAYQHGVKTKEEWMKAQGISVDEHIEENNLEEMHGDANSYVSDAALERRIKEQEEGKKL